jgi:hypothetical protein
MLEVLAARQRGQCPKRALWPLKPLFLARANSFLKLLGGLNKGRPNAEDLKHAEEFAQNLKQNR